MDKKVKVTYIFHSGFLVETEHSYLLFDYWKGELPQLSGDKHLYVFASHFHHDHYDKSIYKLEHSCHEVDYILSKDIKKHRKDWKMAEKVTFIDHNEEAVVGKCEIKTLKSTDEGVAFIVKVDGHTIYHAGDLHWWDWPGEPEDENHAAGLNYKKEIEELKNIPIDIAFVVLDPRQESSGGWGMDYFLKNVNSRYVFPMHCWEKYEIIREYKAVNDRKFPMHQIMDINVPGQHFVIS